MKENKLNPEHWADVLRGARMNGSPIGQISKEVSSFSRSEAYEIQELQSKNSSPAMKFKSAGKWASPQRPSVVR